MIRTPQGMAACEGLFSWRQGSTLFRWALYEMVIAPRYEGAAFSCNGRPRCPKQESDAADLKQRLVRLWSRGKIGQALCSAWLQSPPELVEHRPAASLSALPSQRKGPARKPKRGQLARTGRGMSRMPSLSSEG
jgi:hypothetical protein